MLHFIILVNEVKSESQWELFFDIGWDNCVSQTCVRICSRMLLTIFLVLRACSCPNKLVFCTVLRKYGQVSGQPLSRTRSFNRLT